MPDFIIKPGDISISGSNLKHLRTVGTLNQNIRFQLTARNTKNL